MPSRKSSITRKAVTEEFQQVMDRYWEAYLLRHEMPNDRIDDPGSVFDFWCQLGNAAESARQEQRIRALRKARTRR